MAWDRGIITRHRFAYREEGNPPILRPTVDVQLYLPPHGEWTTRALIDTGAPITVFDRGAGDALLVRFDRAGAETGSIAILGAQRQIQFETIDLCLANDPSYVWSARVAFIKDPSFQMVFQGILGTEGFLDKWAVTFNKYYEYFELLSPDEAYDAYND
ncbi:hypothetical protein [Micromonospora aurantiaca (nom. illeg.)]|uniref:hypothetical protein n=1 Tax=Micromonospora aurantiaca (nom. illeg.) TaxID=47850 RepID=UPI0037880C19